MKEYERFLKKVLKQKTNMDNNEQKNNLNDLTFITNDTNGNLKDKFRSLVKDTQFFDVLVGYFYTSGFYEIYEQLEAKIDEMVMDLYELTEEEKEIVRNS